LYLYTVLHYLY